VFDHVYAAPHPLLEAERADYLSYLTELDDGEFNDRNDDHVDEDGLS